MFSSSQIFAHRGYWHTKSDQNSIKSIKTAKLKNFSAEIDLRYSNGKIIVSHDDSNYLLSKDIREFDLTGIRLALNIKSDGLFNESNILEKLLQNDKSFFFDGSIPEMLKYRELDLPHALRLSEFEKTIPWATSYIWMDGFYSDWWLKSNGIRKYMDKSEVIMVSPEIHNRPHKNSWDWIIARKIEGYSLSICTDLPEEFVKYSGNSN
jgi:hypothetical protein